MSTNELLYYAMTNTSRSTLHKNEKVDSALKAVTGYDVYQLQPKDKRAELTIPRQIGMFFYLRAGHSLWQAGIRFHRDHATAVHSRRVITNLYGQVSETRLTAMVDEMERLTGIESGLRISELINI